MLSLGKKKAALCALGQKVPLKALPHVQPIFLLQMLIGLSQLLNGSAAQPEALARALILDGQQRLRKLRKAAPHLDLSLEPLLNRIRPNGTADGQLSDEESAAQAMLEMCLGLLLHWLSKADNQPYPHASSIAMKYLPPFDVLLPSHPSSLHPLRFRARSCLIS
jgi:hypothetical protein